jgi:hypothetical protein
MASNTSSGSANCVSEYEDGASRRKPQDDQPTSQRNVYIESGDKIQYKISLPSWTLDFVTADVKHNLRSGDLFLVRLVLYHTASTPSGP